uniref:PWWP domain-containing protein n=1 Tax=Trichogramma kaykai TaxID=54128 RepID=A0ABD2X107_9HYME
MPNEADRVSVNSQATTVLASARDNSCGSNSFNLEYEEEECVDHQIAMESLTADHALVKIPATASSSAGNEQTASLNIGKAVSHCSSEFVSSEPVDNLLSATDGLEPTPTFTQNVDRRTFGRQKAIRPKATNAVVEALLKATRLRSTKTIDVEPHYSREHSDLFCLEPAANKTGGILNFIDVDEEATDELDETAVEILKVFHVGEIVLVRLMTYCLWPAMITRIGSKSNEFKFPISVRTFNTDIRGRLMWHKSLTPLQLDDVLKWSNDEIIQECKTQWDVTLPSTNCKKVLHQLIELKIVDKKVVGDVETYTLVEEKNYTDILKNHSKLKSIYAKL